jgi:triphosphatase
LSFRLRAEEGGWIQTLESHEFISANFLSRDEWEDVIAADSPDPAAPETGPRLLDVVGVEDLRPLFRTIVQRTVIELELPSTARIEIAVEEGDIRGAEMDVSAPLCEIELASKSGDPAAVYEVALLLLKVAPLRIETLSKSDRGYRLVAPEGGAAAAMQATPVALDAAMTVEAALQNIGRACISHLLRNEPAVWRASLTASIAARRGAFVRRSRR